MKLRAWMLCASLGSLTLLGLGGCGDKKNADRWRNPFAAEPFVQTPVPKDFALVIDEDINTFYARRHVRQVVDAKTLTSKSTYTLFRDYNNAVSETYTDTTPVTREQVQQLWDEVSRRKLMSDGMVWQRWMSDTDTFRRDEKVLQIRANGFTKSYRQPNTWDASLRDLALDVQAIRLPAAGRSAASQPATAPATTQP